MLVLTILPTCTCSVPSILLTISTCTVELCRLSMVTSKDLVVGVNDRPVLEGVILARLIRLLVAKLALAVIDVVGIRTTLATVIYVTVVKVWCYPSVRSLAKYNT